MPALVRKSRSSLRILALVPALVCSAACAMGGPLVRGSEAVGPDPRAAARAEETGTLAVFTGIVPNLASQLGENTEEMRAPFTVLDAQRRLVADVHHERFHDRDVHPIKLAPGSYIVVGPGLSGRTFQQDVEVVVRIDAGKTTEVHLDQPFQLPEGLANNGLSAKAMGDWRLGWSARSGARLGTEGELRYVGSPVAARLVAESKAGSLSVGAAEKDALADLSLGTADLAGVAGAATPEAGISCKSVGSDQLAFVVRADSPLKSLDAGQVAALTRGQLTNWSALGQPAAPVVLLVARGTGAEQRVTSARAIPVEPAEVLRRVALASDAIAVTSQAAVQGDARVRSLSAPAEGTAIPLSLCAASSNAKAMQVVAWAAGSEGGAVAEKLGLHKAGEPTASR
jgi:PBP superfamily domain